MGNQFLASIRETDTMIQVVRCFEDENIVHVDDSVDARRDIETIQIELALADLATVERRRERVQKGVKGGEKNAKAELDVLDKLQPALEEFKPAKSVSLTEEERAIARNFFLLTMKPTIYAANVNEATLAAPEENEQVRAIREVAASEGAECLVICAQLEADLVGLAPEERREYLESLGVKSSGVDQLIQSAYRVLGPDVVSDCGRKRSARLDHSARLARAGRRRRNSFRHRSRLHPRRDRRLRRTDARRLICRRQRTRSDETGRQRLHHAGRRCGELSL